MTQNDIVQKLWNLCDVLRDDGINYSDYVTELVLLLFIKMEYENTQTGVLQQHKLPEYARWDVLTKLSGISLLNHYRQTLLKLSLDNDPLIAAIYADAQTRVPSMPSTGSRRKKTVSATCTKACWRKTRTRPSPVPVSTSRRAR